MTRLFALLTICLVGFRHGFDVDHIAAIGDIAAGTPSRKRALYLSTLYALGHGLVVFLLGVAVAAAGSFLPAELDAVMARVIGATLVGLGLYVLVTLARRGSEFGIPSRGGLVLAAVRRLKMWAGREATREVVIEHEHEHRHEGSGEHHHDVGSAAGHATIPAVRRIATATSHSHHHTHRAVEPRDPFAGYGSSAAFGIGMIHGIGAETPTQLLVLISAAGVAHLGQGTLVVTAFVLGLIVANTVLAAAAAFSMSGPRRVPQVYAVVAALSGLFSIGLGLSYLWPG